MIFQNGRPIRQTRLQQIFFYLWGVFASSGGIFVFCAIWHYAALSLGDLVLPQPLAVFRRAYAMLDQLQENQVLVTLYRVAIALFFAITFGMIAGILAGLSKTLNVLLRPMVTVLLGMPPIIWIVLALFWFDVSHTSIIFTVFMSVIPLSFAAAVQGMLTVDEDLKEMLNTYHISWLGQIHQLYIPHLINYLLPAAIVAVGMGVKITIMAELLGANEGIGSKIADARTMLETQEVLAYVVLVLAIIMMIEYLVLEPIRIMLTPWEN